MILVVGIVIIYPIIELFIGSLTSTSYDGKTIFVGLSNFKLVVADPLFKTAIINNLKLFLMVPVLTLVSLVLATLLSNRIRGWQFYRAIVFIPYILSITAVGIIFSYIKWCENNNTYSSNFTWSSNFVPCKGGKIIEQ